jgi:hemoglobin-like flavoprotein
VEIDLMHIQINLKTDTKMRVIRELLDQEAIDTIIQAWESRGTVLLNFNVKSEMIVLKMSEYKTIDILKLSFEDFKVPKDFTVDLLKGGTE